MKWWECKCVWSWDRSQAGVFPCINITHHFGILFSCATCDLNLCIILHVMIASLLQIIIDSVMHSHGCKLSVVVNCITNHTWPCHAILVKYKTDLSLNLASMPRHRAKPNHEKYVSSKPSQGDHELVCFCNDITMPCIVQHWDEGFHAFNLNHFCTH